LEKQEEEQKALAERKKKELDEVMKTFESVKKATKTAEAEDREYSLALMTERQLLRDVKEVLSSVSTVANGSCEDLIPVILVYFFSSNIGNNEKLFLLVLVIEPIKI
jgi:hypothetical protein